MTPDPDEYVLNDWLAEPVAEHVPVVQPVETLACWRCDLTFAIDLPRCPHCRADNREVTPRRYHRLEPPKESGPMAAMLWAYFAMLFVSVIHAGVLISMHKDLDKDQMIVLGTVFAGIDAVITFIALAACKPLVVMPELQLGRAAVVWILAMPVLAIILGIGTLYIGMLRDYIGGNAWLDADATEVNLVSIVTICIMPAVMEELFFRYVAFGTLRRVISLHATVLVTSVMFALAHLYNPLGMPYLFLVGAFLGYARSLGGGLLLSMVLHFLHNLVVIYTESGA